MREEEVDELEGEEEMMRDAEEVERPRTTQVKHKGEGWMRGERSCWRGEEYAKRGRREGTRAAGQLSSFLMHPTLFAAGGKQAEERSSPRDPEPSCTDPFLDRKR